MIFHVVHFDKPLVKSGGSLVEGEVIAEVGNNGLSRQPHIHIGTYRGSGSKRYQAVEKTCEQGTVGAAGKSIGTIGCAELIRSKRGCFSYVLPESRMPARHPLRPIRAMVAEALVQLDRKLEKLYASSELDGCA